MLRSKSRSGALDGGANHHSSIVSRTFSSSRICRGDPLIDKNALVSIERRSSAKIITSSENQIARVSTMQRQMGRIEEELKLTKDQLDAAGEDRDRALDQLRESKMMVHEANSRLSEALSPRKAEKIFDELKTVKELLSNSQNELAAKEKNIESMKLELDQAKQSENNLADKVSSLSRLEDELRVAKISETRAMDLCSESRKRIAVLEDELEKRKQSENEVSESGVSQTKELEAAKIELKESKLQIVSLREELKNLQSSSAVSSRVQNGVATSEAGGPQSEIDVLKKQLKAAIQAEEHSTKAMNDLALALNEVATESNHTKETLISTESELEHVKEQAEQLKVMVRSIKDDYQKLLNEEKKETELHKNTADRLRVEAEESFLAWHGQEMGFVNVIKEVEVEKACTQQENVKLTESLKAVEDTSRRAREENHKLRDVLKQALNEANVAKEAASIAQADNSELKDYLAEKEETLDSLTRENDKLRISEAAANEKIKELNRLLSQAHSQQKTDYKDPGTAFISPESVFDDHEEDNSKQHKEDYSKQHKKDAAIAKGFNFDLQQIKLHNKFEDQDEDDTLVDEDPVKPEALEESTFDTSTETPKSEAHKPKLNLFHHHQHEDDTPVDEDPVKAEALKGSIFGPSTETPKSEAHKPKLNHHHHQHEDNTLVDEDPVKAEALKGSIFDLSTETPKSEAHKPKLNPFHHRHHHHRKKSSLSNVETLNLDDLNHLDGDSNYDSEGTHCKEDYSKQEDFSKQHKKASAVKKGFSFDLHKIKFNNKSEDEVETLVDEDPVKAETLKGSIFDLSTETPKSEGHKPKLNPFHHHRHHSHHLRKKSSSSNGETLNPDDLNHLDGDSNYDSEGTHYKEDFSKQEDYGKQHKDTAAIKKGFSFDLHKHKEDHSKQEDNGKQHKEVGAVKKGFSFDLRKHKEDNSKQEDHSKHHREASAIKKGFSFDLRKLKEDNSKQEDHSKHHREASAIKKGFSFDLHKIKLNNKVEDEDEDDTLVDEDPVKAETLKGSIFDTSTETPKSEAHKPKLLAPKHPFHHHLRKKSTASNVGTLNSDDLNHQDGYSSHDSEGTHSDESSHRRKKSAALKNFGYLLMRKNFTQHTSHEPTL
ncbi:hypothetical protein POM88_011048 [Heracleum sosnowskyi]|uniref:Uncharacterized protein n=1 Tax=Heracleum sosnowskyi TaxID=360622 RepID=A0AAD8IX80_9APIA|nr:hypothetical protein POM88_011048 [Heracleum sosnowskyi]